MTVTTAPGRTSMQVRKRNGDDEPVDVNKIVRAVDRVSDDLADVDPMRVATRTISGLYDGATTAELDRLSIQTAAEMIGEEPQYSRLAARLLSATSTRRCATRASMSFSQSVALGHAEGLIGDETARVRQGQRPQARLRDRRRTPTGASSTSGCAPSTTATCCGTRRAGWWSRPRSTSCCASPAGLARSPGEAIEFYRLMSSLAYLPRQPDAVQLRHPAHPDVVVLPRGQPARRPRLDLRALRRRWRSCRSSPAASASPSPGSARAAR